MQQLIDVQRKSEVGKTSYGHVRENCGKMHCTEHHLAWTVSKQKFIAHAQLLPCFFHLRRFWRFTHFTLRKAVLAYYAQSCC